MFAERGRDEGLVAGSIQFELDIAAMLGAVPATVHVARRRQNRGIRGRKGAVDVCIEAVVREGRAQRGDRVALCNDQLGYLAVALFVSGLQFCGHVARPARKRCPRRGQIAGFRRRRDEVGVLVATGMVVRPCPLFAPPELFVLPARRFQRVATL